MEETTEASQQADTPEVTDEMLDRAAEEVTEEVVVVEEGSEVEAGAVEETATEDNEDAPEEPEDNRERSRLGRRVTELEGLIKEQSAASEKKLTDAIDKLAGLLGGKQEPEEPEYFEMPETREDLNALIAQSISEVTNQQKQQEEAAKSQYSEAYVDAVRTLLDGESEETSKALIEKLSEDEFNRRYSRANTVQAGVLDAAKNVTAAREALRKAPTLKSEKPQGPLGGGDGGAIPPKSRKVIKLDPEAAALAKELNMSDEEITRAMRNA
jgi:hypothetical protein